MEFTTVLLNVNAGYILRNPIVCAPVSFALTNVTVFSLLHTVDFALVVVIQSTTHSFPGA